MTPDRSALIERLEAAAESASKTIMGRRGQSILHPLLAEAAAALRDLTEWRDIATAPKDGAEFQAWWSGQWQPRARFNPDTEAFELWGRVDYDQDGWDAFSLDLADGWLPLPSAPNQAKEPD